MFVLRPFHKNDWNLSLTVMYDFCSSTVSRKDCRISSASPIEQITGLTCIQHHGHTYWWVSYWYSVCLWQWMTMHHQPHHEKGDICFLVKPRSDKLYFYLMNVQGQPMHFILLWDVCECFHYRVCSQAWPMPVACCWECKACDSIWCPALRKAKWLLYAQ